MFKLTIPPRPQVLPPAGTPAVRPRLLPAGEAAGPPSGVTRGLAAIGWILVFAVALQPASAWALRPQPARSGLEESLTSGDSEADWVVQRVLEGTGILEIDFDQLQALLRQLQERNQRLILRIRPAGRTAVSEFGEYGFDWQSDLDQEMSRLRKAIWPPRVEIFSPVPGVQLSRAILFHVPSGDSVRLIAGTGSDLAHAGLPEGFSQSLRGLQGSQDRQRGMGVAKEEFLRQIRQFLKDGRLRVDGQPLVLRTAADRDQFLRLIDELGVKWPEGILLSEEEWQEGQAGRREAHLRELEEKILAELSPRVQKILSRLMSRIKRRIGPKRDFNADAAEGIQTAMGALKPERFLSDRLEPDSDPDQVLKSARRALAREAAVLHRRIADLPVYGEVLAQHLDRMEGILERWDEKALAAENRLLAEGVGTLFRDHDPQQMPATLDRLRQIVEQTDRLLHEEILQTPSPFQDPLRIWQAHAVAILAGAGRLPKPIADRFFGDPASYVGTAALDLSLTLIPLARSSPRDPGGEIIGVMGILFLLEEKSYDRDSFQANRRMAWEGVVYWLKQDIAHAARTNPSDLPSSEEISDTLSSVLSQIGSPPPALVKDLFIGRPAAHWTASAVFANTLSAAAAELGWQSVAARHREDALGYEGVARSLDPIAKIWNPSSDPVTTALRRRIRQLGRLQASTAGTFNTLLRTANAYRTLEASPEAPSSDRAVAEGAFREALKTARERESRVERYHQLFNQVELYAMLQRDNSSLAGLQGQREQDLQEFQRGRTKWLGVEDRLRSAVQTYEAEFPKWAAHTGLEEPELLSRRESDGRMYVGDGRWIVPFLGADDYTKVLIETLRIPGMVRPEMEILDLGIGDGAATVGLAGKVRRVIGVDEDPIALEQARTNFQLNDLANVELFQGDFFDPRVTARRYPLIVVNPPALPLPLKAKGVFHPSAWRAIYGGPDGRQVMERILREAPFLLTPDGALLMVHSHILDLEKTRRLAAQWGLKIETLLERDVPIVPPPGYESMLLRFRESIRAANGIDLLEKDGHPAFRLYVLKISKIPNARSGPEEALAGSTPQPEQREITLEQIQKASSWSEIFGNDHPVVWEIGFAPGLALKSRAEKERDKNFLGVELFYPALEYFDQRQLPENARIVIADVRLLVEVLPTGLRSIDRIVIDFPSPPTKWSPRPYLFEPNDFLATLLGLLRPGGQLQARTESSLVKDRFREVVQQRGDPSWFTIQETADPGLPSTPFTPSSQNSGRSTFQICYTVPDQGTPPVDASGQAGLPVAPAGLEEPAEQARDWLIGEIHRQFTTANERTRSFHSDSLEKLYHQETVGQETIIHLGPERYHLDIRLRVVDGILLVSLRYHLLDSDLESVFALAYEEGVEELFKQIQNDPYIQSGQWNHFRMDPRTRIYLWSPPSKDFSEHPLAQALKGMSAELSKLLKWRNEQLTVQVIGRSVADEYPRLQILADLMPTTVLIDPGGAQTPFVAQWLWDSGIRQAFYYGNPDEYEHFVFEATGQGRGIHIQGPVQANTPSFREFLQGLLASLTALSPADISKKVHLQKMEEALGILGEA